MPKRYLSSAKPLENLLATAHCRRTIRILQATLPSGLRLPTMPIPQFIDRLESKYQTALANQNLLFIPTESSSLTSNAGIHFQIVYAPSLSRKPSHHSQTTEKPIEKDPFSPPYVPDLLVCEFEGGDGHSDQDPEDDQYVVLLNKFCVVPRHFLLVTKGFVPQTSPPNPTDLYNIRLILEQANLIEPQNEWLAFYNCGPESGASQPHKHFQFIHVKKGSSPYGDLIARSPPPREGDVFNLAGLSFSHFIVLLPNLTFSIDESSHREEMMMELASRFMKLLDSMIDRLRHLSGSDSSSGSIKASLSYNFVMTRTYMILVPRSKEEFGNKNVHGRISINSLGVGAGMILVKNQDQLDQLRQVGVDNVLADVTFPILKDLINPCSEG